MKLTSKLFTCLFIFILSGCKTGGILDAMNKSNRENNAMNNAQYDMSKDELWIKVDQFYKTRFTNINYNKDRNYIESAWGVARMGTTEKRISYRVTIVGNAQPYKLAVVARQGERYLQNNKWTDWTDSTNLTLEKQFKKQVYEHFNGPLVYDPKKVAADEAEADRKKQEERRQQLERKELSQDEWLEQSRKRMEKELNK